MVVPVLVRDVMTPEVVTVAPDAPVAEAVERIRQERIGSVVVVDGESVVGILTDSDLVDLFASGATPSETVAADCMSSPVRTTPPSASVVEAAERLAADAIDQLPVVEDGRLVGLVSVTELSAYLPQSLLKPAVDRADWAAEVEDEAPAGVSVGDAVTFSKAVRDEDVAAFARISGDENPLHLDESFAAKTRFGRRIVHGLLAASLFSAALSRLPGLVIYLSQDVRFLAPVDVGDRVRVRCEVIQNLGNDRFRLSTEGHDGDDRVLVGEAVVLVDAVSGEE